MTGPQPSHPQRPKDDKAHCLLRAADIFLICQLLSLFAGIAAVRLLGGGAGIILQFIQVTATIVFLWVFTWQGDRLISGWYPDLEYFKSKITKNRDPYTPLLYAEAAGQGDELTKKLLNRRMPMMIRAVVLLSVMVALDPFFAALFAMR